MGTNYYHYTVLCEHCGSEERVHIGKSSIGWQFLFRGYEDIRSLDDWMKRFAAGGVIRDEYGKEWAPENFRDFVERKRSEPNRDTYLTEWVDQQGYAFTLREFS